MWRPAPHGVNVKDRRAILGQGMIAYRGAESAAFEIGRDVLGFLPS
jgi:hypothetical protein